MRADEYLVEMVESLKKHTWYEQDEQNMYSINDEPCTSEDFRKVREWLENGN